MRGTLLLTTNYDIWWWSERESNFINEGQNQAKDFRASYFFARDLSLSWLSTRRVERRWAAPPPLQLQSPSLAAAVAIGSRHCKRKSKINIMRIHKWMYIIINTERLFRSTTSWMRRRRHSQENDDIATTIPGQWLPPVHDHCWVKNDLGRELE